MKTLSSVAVLDPGPDDITNKAFEILIESFPSKRYTNWCENGEGVLLKKEYLLVQAPGHLPSPLPVLNSSVLSFWDGQGG